jgi:hypothetical protein
MRAVKHDKGL